MTSNAAKRIKKLERCLRATLKDLAIINEKYPLISWASQAQSGDLVEAALVDARNRITRALKEK